MQGTNVLTVRHSVLIETAKMNVSSKEIFKVKDKIGKPPYNSDILSSDSSSCTSKSFDKVFTKGEDLVGSFSSVYLGSTKKEVDKESIQGEDLVSSFRPLTISTIAESSEISIDQVRLIFDLSFTSKC